MFFYDFISLSNRLDKKFVGIEKIYKEVAM